MDSLPTPPREACEDALARYWVEEGDDAGRLDAIVGVALFLACYAALWFALGCLTVYLLGR